MRTVRVLTISTYDILAHILLNVKFKNVIIYKIFLLIIIHYFFNIPKILFSLNFGKEIRSI